MVEKGKNTYQDVVWLNVPVDESHLVDAVYGTNQLGDVEPGGWELCSINYKEIMKNKKKCK